MKARSLFTLAALAGSAATLLKITISYRSWKQDILDNLQSNSRISNTAHGPIEYSVKGNANGSIVLISHGTPGGYDHSAAFASLFTGNIVAINISRPGYLRTPLANNKTPEAQADLYAALLDKLDIKRVTMLGISGGGPSALQFAIRHPERCSNLVLVCAVTYHYNEYEQIQMASPIQRFIQSQIARFLPHDLVYFFMAIRAKWFNAPILERFYCSFTYNELRKSGYENDIAQYVHLQTYPLERISAPTLVLHGDADNNVSIEHAKHAIAHIPNAQLVIDEDGNHDFFVKHKEKIIPIIETFVGA